MEGDQEDLSSVSFVSTISASSSIHHPRPPDCPKPTSQRFHTKQTGKVVRSPYLATSTPYPSKKKPRRITNDDDSVFNHEAPSIKDKWAKPVKALGHPVPHPSGSSFLQSLMMTGGFSAMVTGNTVNKRKRTHSAASVHSVKREKTKSTSGGGALTSESGHLDLIALRDETLRLKQLLNSVMQERDLAKAQQIKLQQTVGKKDKQIQDMLAAGHITSRDATRSLVGSKKLCPGSQPSSGTNQAISSLRQKVHSLEQALREKEESLVSLKSDLSVTKVKEMEIQTETYYREVCRLTAMLSEREGHHSDRDAQIKLKALNQATVKMASQLERMEQRNTRLKKKLDMYESDKRAGPENISHNEQGLRGSIADQYVDHKRSQLLSAIVDLELRIREHDASIKSLCSEMENKKAHYERRIGELTGAQNDSNNQIQSLQTKLSELVSSRDKLRNVVRKLKDDRTHYRTVAENTQESLASVQEHLENEKMNKSGVIKELEGLREKHQNEMTAREHARKLASRKSHVFIPERERQQAAAITLQHHWKHRQASLKQKRFEDERNQAVLDIQSALKGHVARKQMILSASTTHQSKRTESNVDLAISEGSSDELSDSSDALETIQSAMRGYFARQMAMRDLQRPINNIESTSPAHETTPLSAGDKWRANDNHTRTNTSTLVGYQPPNRTVSDIQTAQIRQQRNRRKHGLSNHTGPWSNKLHAAESSDDCMDSQPPLSRSLHSANRLSSSNDSDIAHMDNGVLSDELH